MNRSCLPRPYGGAFVVRNGIDIGAEQNILESHSDWIFQKKARQVGQPNLTWNGPENASKYLLRAGAGA